MPHAFGSPQGGRTSHPAVSIAMPGIDFPIRRKREKPDFMDRTLRLSIIVLCEVFFLFEFSGVDLWIQDHLYSFSNRQWLIDANDPIPRLLFYTGPKILIWIIALALLAVAIFHGRVPFLKIPRRDISDRGSDHRDSPRPRRIGEIYHKHSHPRADQTLRWGRAPCQSYRTLPGQRPSCKTRPRFPRRSRQRRLRPAISRRSRHHPPRTRHRTRDRPGFRHHHGTLSDAERSPLPKPHPLHRHLLLDHLPPLASVSSSSSFLKFRN